MTRILRASVVVAALVAAAGCNKPSEDSCRRALANMRVLLGTDGPNSEGSVAGDVRRCRGGSTKKAVTCAAEAATLEELRKCDFMSTGKHPMGLDPGSAGSGSGT